MKTKIEHILKDREVAPDTEILLIGTFNPKMENNEADFFYGRGRNYLWRLLPGAFGDESYKNKSVEEKEEYIKDKKIDFVDLISSVKVEKLDNYKILYKDAYIDDKAQWRDILSILPTLGNLKKVAITRKTYTGIPNMRKQIRDIQSYCIRKNISFEMLFTPSRYHNEAKQKIWTDFLNPSQE